MRLAACSAEVLGYCRRTFAIWFATSITLSFTTYGLAGQSLLFPEPGVEGVEPATMNSYEKCGNLVSSRAQKHEVERSGTNQLIRDPWHMG